MRSQVTGHRSQNLLKIFSITLGLMWFSGCSNNNSGSSSLNSSGSNAQVAPTYNTSSLCAIPSNGWFNDSGFQSVCVESATDYNQCDGASQCVGGVANCYAAIPGGCYCANGCATQTTTTCPTDYTLCGNICSNTQIDSANCGSCGNGCPSGPCVNGTCTCSSNINYNTDPNNCGSCGNKCPSNNTCQQGTCSSPCGGNDGLCTTLADVQACCGENYINQVCPGATDNTAANCNCYNC